MSPPRKGPFLVRPKMAEASRPLETGACVPRTGNYRVSHEEHRLPAEVVLLQDERFPRCAQCGNPVAFALIRVMDNLLSDSVCKVYELPVIEDSEAGESAEAAS